MQGTLSRKFFKDGKPHSSDETTFSRDAVIMELSEIDSDIKPIGNTIYYLDGSICFTLEMKTYTHTVRAYCEFKPKNH